MTGKFQQGKELDTDWCQGTFLSAELTDIICDDPLQPEEADDDDTELANLCDSGLLRGCCSAEID